MGLSCHLIETSQKGRVITMATGKRNIFMIFVVLTLLLFPFSAYAIDVLPAADGHISWGTNVSTNLIQVLNVPGYESRGIIEFPLNSACTPLRRAILRLNVFGSTGPFPFNINVYAYAGDGQLTLADNNAGTLASSFAFNGDETSVDIDVTESILTFISSSSDYAGFNLRFEPGSDITSNGPFVAFNARANPPAGRLILECDTASIPTMSEWGMIFMSLILAGSAFWMIRRRQVS